MPEPFDPPSGPRPFALRVDRESGSVEGPLPQPPAAEPPRPMDRHAAEWGLASLLTGGFLALFVPGLMVFDLLFWLSGRQVVATAAHWAMALVVVASVIGVLILIGACAASLAIGVRALQSAARRRQPAGLALAGTMVSAGALVSCTFAGVGMLMIILTFTD